MCVYCFCPQTELACVDKNNLSVVYTGRYLCIVYIISHLLEKMYENQIFILLKCPIVTTQPFSLPCK